MKSVSSTSTSVTSTAMTTTTTSPTLPKSAWAPPKPQLPAFPQANTAVFPGPFPSVGISHHFPSSNSSVSAVAGPTFAAIGATKNNFNGSVAVNNKKQYSVGIGISGNY
jgi:hypothetical protein